MVQFTPELASKLEENLQQTWSSEQIAEHRRVSGVSFVCFNTIYRWLYAGRLTAGEVKVLRHKGKRRKPKVTRGRFLAGKTIGGRPKVVKKRTTVGHWELDTVVSSRGKSRACAATFIERKTRLYVAIKMPDRKRILWKLPLVLLPHSFHKGHFLQLQQIEGRNLPVMLR